MKKFLVLLIGILLSIVCFAQTNPIIVRALGAIGGENLKLIIDGSTVASWTMSTSYQNFTASGSGMVELHFTNDDQKEYGMDIQADYIDYHGTILQAEDQKVNTGVYINGSCGGSYSDMLQCNGYIRFDTSSVVSVSGTLGDVNGDGLINIVDALMTAQYYVELNPGGFDVIQADVDCNGTISIIDALQIARYYVGLILRFYCPTPTPTIGPQRPMYAYGAAVENSCMDCDLPALPDPSQLPKISQLPNPFISVNGTPISKKSEWHCRRQEIIKQAEKYIYGEKPAPDMVTGTVNVDKVSVHVQYEGRKIDFSAKIKLPSTGQAPYPAIINVGAGDSFGMSIPESIVLNQGVAIIYYNHYEIGQEGQPEDPSARTKPNLGLFYDLYGGFHSAGLLMSWAWGASRIIDVLQNSESGIIDWQRLGVTGCSRNGKGAFAIGLFDERIALTIPHETSTAGVPAYRIVDVLNTERTDHNYYGLNWLSNNFAPFVYQNGTSNAVKLPIDTHSLIATFAPRGLLIFENPGAKQMSAPAGHMAALGGMEVYKALGCERNLTYFSAVNGGHCTYFDAYTDPLIKCIARFLKHEDAKTGGITTGSGSLNRSDWINWIAPTLEDDTDIYNTN